MMDIKEKLKDIFLAYHRNILATYMTFKLLDTKVNLLLLKKVLLGIIFFHSVFIAS